MDIERILGEEGLVAKSLKHYEKREEQIEMLKAVELAISSSSHLIVEAGTGVGKSLAYLIPFIYWATEEKKRVVISTYTKALQQQLVEKDLPFLEEALKINFKFALCLGGQNYLCLRRCLQPALLGLFDSRKKANEINKILRWQEKTKIGLRGELPFEPEDEVWDKVCRQPDLCLGKRCPQRNDCYYNKAKQKEYRSQILVTNHHLYFANLASGEQVLPDFEAVVFDEAQTLENVATSYLGIEVSNFKIKYLLDSIFNSRTGKGLLTRIDTDKKRREDLEKALNEVRSTADIFFSSLDKAFSAETEDRGKMSEDRSKMSNTKRIRKKDFIYNYLAEPLSSLSSNLKSLLSGLKEDEERIEVEALLSGSNKIKEDLEAIIKQNLKEHVYWLEIIKRQKYSKYTLHSAPISVADEFKRKVFDKVKTVVLTSATLATNGSFDYIKGRIGLEKCREALLFSPFNYSQNVFLHISTSSPDPKAEAELYETHLMNQLKEILSITGGRTFILFTNFKMLNKMYERLKEEFPENCLLKQGELPSYRLVEKFKEEGTSVLLGTNTFWQGIDVPGPALECVVITKLPFAVPDEPLTEAKMEMLREQNKNPFIHYQLPQAIIMLKQGFGRLIRSKEDKGMVAILDPRIKTRFYGQAFLKSLPACKEVTDLEEVREFFSKNRKGRKNHE